MLSNGGEGATMLGLRMLKLTELQCILASETPPPDFDDRSTPQVL